MVLLIVLLCLSFFSNVKGCVYARYGDVYHPVDVCMSYNDWNLSMELHCYNETLFELYYLSSPNCNGSPQLEYEYAYGNCNVNVTDLCDYVGYTVFITADETNLDCSSLPSASHSQAEIINECVYMESYNISYISTCIEDLWVITYFENATCNGDPYFVYHEDDQCDSTQSSHIDITTCTRPMNQITNKCGYVQEFKNSKIIPLNQCIVEDKYSYYLYKCVSDTVYKYEYSNYTTKCDAEPDSNYTILPISYSCSEQQCDSVYIKEYENNNCTITQLESNLIYFTRTALVTDECFNWFDDDNNILSSKYVCNYNNISYLEYKYLDSNCQTLSEVISFTEQCSNNTQLSIECNVITDQPTTTPTTAEPTMTPITAMPTTAEPTIPTYSIDDNIQRIYVSANGWDSDECGTTKATACGTMGWATRTFNTIKQNIEIMIDSQNHEDIEHWTSYTYPGYNFNPCIPLPIHESKYSNLNIIFDAKIETMHDWYPKELCEAGDNSMFPYNHIFFYSMITDAKDSSLTITNLIIDNYEFDGNNSQYYIVQSQSLFVCNSCLFSNITIRSGHQGNHDYSALIIASRMEFNDNVFKDISYIPSSDFVDDFDYDFSFIYLITIYGYGDSRYLNTFIFRNNYLENINNLHSFAHFMPHQRSFGNNIDSDGSIKNYTGETRIEIESTNANNIFVIDALFYYDADAVYLKTASISLLNTNISDLFYGSAWHSVGDASNSQISIKNTIVHTPQVIEEYLETKALIGRVSDEEYYGSIFVFESTADEVLLENIDIHYDYADDFVERCRMHFSIHNWITLWDTSNDQSLTPFYHLQYYCKIPQQFIFSRSQTTIIGSTFQNDITNQTIESYKEYIIDEVYSVIGSSTYPIYIDFVYSKGDIIETNDYHLINNEGTLNIKHCFVYGAGVHYAMIYSPSGDVMIDNMYTIPDTYCTKSTDQDVKCVYNPDALQISFWISFSEVNNDYNTVLIIRNSNIFGSNGIAIDINGAAVVYLYNVTIEMAALGIISSVDSYIEIKDSKFYDIGSYYGSTTFALYALDPSLQPFYIQSKQVLIQNSVFSWIDPYQFHLFSSDYHQSYKTDEESEYHRKITLKGNQFYIDDTNVHYKYPFNHSLEARHNHDVNLNQYLNQYFVVKGWLRIPQNTEAIMINNKFMFNENNRFVNNDILFEYNMSNLYVTNMNTTCISGMEGYNFAIWLEEGNITSCIKSEMNEYFGNTECESSLFGSIDIDALDYTSNIFNINYNISSIINVADQSFISLYDTIINPINSVMNSLVIKSGNMLLKDTIIINSTYHQNKNINTIKIDNTHCNVICLELMNYNPNLIATLHAMCNTSMHINNTNNNMVSLIDEYMYSFEDVTHWMPWMININTKNDEYFPGGTLDLIYNIIDKENNSIETVNTPINIYIESTNPQELFLNEQIEISENGECPQCKIYIQSSSITQIGNQYSLKLSVINYNLLLVNPFINITIIECPSGSGVTGNALQCEECKIEYFSLLPTTSSCMKCNNNINGVTCFGTNNIHIEQDYWIAVYQYTQLIHDKYFSAVNGTVNHNNHIISGSCPPGYCCKLETGCNFITDSNVLCAPYRDPNVVLCGKCLDGYSELLFSTSCGLCKHSAWYIIIYPILLALLWALFILITKSTSTSSHKPIAVDANDNDDESNNSSSCCKQICRCTCRSNDSNSNKVKYMSKKRFLNIIEVMIIINLTYYYQTVMNIVSVTNGLPTALIGFMGIFNIDVFSMISKQSASGEGECLFKNMTATQEILASLSTSIITILLILIACLIWIFGKCNILKLCKKEPHLGRTILKVIFLSVGQALNVLFQLLSCISVGNIKVHYFFAEECYGSIWWTALTILIIIVIGFILLFIIIGCTRDKSYQQKLLKTNEYNQFKNKLIGNNDIDQQIENGITSEKLEDWMKKILIEVDDDLLKNNKKEKPWYHSAIWCYKVWFWELIIFGRRLLLSFALIVFDSNDLRSWTAIGLFVYSVIHFIYKPFEYSATNNFELYLLISTIAIIGLDNQYRSDPDNISGQIMITSLILFPLIVIIYYIFSRFGSIKTSQFDDSNLHHVVSSNNLHQVGSSNNLQSSNTGENVELELDITSNIDRPTKSPREQLMEMITPKNTSYQTLDQIDNQ
eukprot:31569_1